MNADQVYKIILYVVGKNNEQGYVSPEDFYRIINSAQTQYVDYLLGEYQKYTSGRQVAVVELSGKEKIRQSVSPLVYNTFLTINPATGIAPYPSDFEIADAMWSVYGVYNIRFVNQPRLAAFANSSIDVIDENPLYMLRSEGFEFLPTNIGIAKMSYIRTPPSIVWGYTLDSNGVPVWNPATSQDPVWSDFDLLNIISRALRMIGVNLDSNTVSQYANEVKTAGQ